ncbi:MAG: hypothetical protein ACRC68_02150, partial [Clostridium sp.]
MGSAENNLQSSKMEYGPGNRLVSYNGIKIEYDEDGNMTKGILGGKLVDLKYDSRNRLIKAVDTEYEYDAENVRTGITENGVKTTFVYNTNAALSELLYRYDTNGDKSYYVYGLGLIGEETTDESYRTYHFDRRGSTVAISDIDGFLSDRFY